MISCTLRLLTAANIDNCIAPLSIIIQPLQPFPPKIIPHYSDDISKMWNGYKSIQNFLNEE